MIFAAFERALHWVVLLVSISLINRFDQHFLYITTASTGVIVYVVFCLIDTLCVRVPGLDMMAFREPDLRRPESKDYCVLSTNALE